MSRPDITDPANMLAVQGDRVLVYKHSDNGHLLLAHVLTLVRVIDVGGQEMRLVNRDDKMRLPDWAFTQKWYDVLRSAPENKQGAKWEVTLKLKAEWQ